MSRHESAITRRIMRALRTEFATLPFWCYKSADRFTSGLPDVIFCANGQFGAIEIKDPKGKVTPIQQYTMVRMNLAKGRTMVVTNTVDALAFVKSFFNKES